MAKTNLELIQELEGRARQIGNRDFSEADAVVRHAEMLSRNIFGPTTKYLTDIADIRFTPNFGPTEDAYKIRVFHNGQTKLINLI